MQQTATRQEERYADGLGEYTSFYGGPSYNYLAKQQAAQQPQSTSYVSQPPIQQQSRQYAATNHQHAISYDLAANVPQVKRDAEGLQLAYHGPSGAPAPYYYTAQGYTRESEGLQSVHYQHYGYQPQYHQQHPQHMIHPAFRQQPQPIMNQAPVPAPLHIRRRSSVTDPSLHQFPQPPTFPTSPTLQQHQQFIHPLSPQPPPPSTLPQLPKGLPEVPQPLKFQSHNSMPSPPTPPRSTGAWSNEDDLNDQIRGLNMGEPSRILGRQPPRFALGTLDRMNTASTMSSTRTSSVPGSPFDQTHRISVAQPNINDVVSLGPPEMSPAEAHAEVLRLIDKADEVSNRKSGSAVKKGFLKRSNMTKPNNNASHSQDALISVLENVAEEGSLPMVKAVIGLGADLVYKSTSKLKGNVKHEALSKAAAAGRASVVDFLLSKGSSFGEVNKKSTFTPIDRALLTAVYAGHADLARMLIKSHGANPMVEQWPREMNDAQHYWAQNAVRLSKTSILDGISHWKNEEQGMSVLRSIFASPKFDPALSVSGVFDNKSELQSAEFANRPWNTTYEYSALACFCRAGWADAVEELLTKKPSPTAYEKDDEVLQYQDKVTRFITPINALTKDTWTQRPDAALRILRLLIEKGFNVNTLQRTANDLGPRTALARALSANASPAIELLTQTRPELVKEVISFRLKRKETKAQPLAASIALEKLDVARVLFRMGAHPRDPAFDTNALEFCASQGGETGTAMLAEMIPQAPELTYAALDVAVRKVNNGCVRVLLDSISAAAQRNEVAALPAIWDMLLPVSPAAINSATQTADLSNLPDLLDPQSNYLALIDMVAAWDAGNALPVPQLPAILAAIKRDNFLGMQKMLSLGIVDGKNLVLNCKAQPIGEQGMWTVLECAEGTSRSNEWLGLLRGHGAPLFT